MNLKAEGKCTRYSSEIYWNDRVNVRGTLLRITGIWTESFLWYSHLEYQGGYGGLITMNLPRNRMKVSGR